MNPTVAQKLIDRAIQFQIYQLALAIAKAPDEAISPQMPELIELRELAQSFDGNLSSEVHDAHAAKHSAS